MKEIAAACAAYFQEHPAYHRILVLLFQKVKSFGGPAGTVRLDDATPEECDAARALFGRSFSAPLRIKTADFEAALQNTPYHGVTLKEVLECYFHTAIQTKREIRSQEDARILRITKGAAASVESPLCLRWLEELSTHRGEGWQLIQKSLAKGEEAVGQALLQACKSMAWLEGHPGRRIRLAVLSAYATSDPHALDVNTLGGKLFLHLLSMGAGVRLPTEAEARAALYYNWGILCDSISSLVTQVGLRLYVGKEEHPAFYAFRLRNEACTLTLTNLAGLTGADSPSGRAYLVENQMVFSQLCDAAAGFHSPLLCTSGQPAIAVIRLLDLLVSAGTDLFYAGDFDGKGLSIALQLLERYPDRLRLWRMTGEDYAQCRSEVRASDKSRALLRSCENTVLAPVAQAIERSGFVGYQELLLPQLQRDLLQKGSGLRRVETGPKTCY